VLIIKSSLREFSTRGERWIALRVRNTLPAKLFLPRGRNRIEHHVLLAHSGLKLQHHHGRSLKRRKDRPDRLGTDLNRLRPVEFLYLSKLKSILVREMVELKNKLSSLREENRKLRQQMHKKKMDSGESEAEQDRSLYNLLQEYMMENQSLRTSNKVI
jgi:hypothetical protein